jgi:NitT/TauT family transport system permease protein
MWVGIGELSKVLIIFLGVVFYNILMISDAVRFVPVELVNSTYTLGGKRRDVLMRVIAPATLPGILDTLRVNVSGAWNYLVIAELIGASDGLGFRIVKAQRFLDTNLIFVCILIIGAIGITLDLGFRGLLRWLVPWSQHGTATA